MWPVCASGVECTFNWWGVDVQCIYNTHNVTVY